MRRTHLCFFLFLVFAPAVSAQNTVAPTRGFTPGGSYALSDIETISTTNGNMMLRIPLGGLPAGRGGMGAGLNLTYNSKVWDTPINTVPDDGGRPVTRNYLKPSQEGGWRYAFEYKLKLVNRLDEYTYSYFAPTCETEYGTGQSKSSQIYKLQMSFPDGSVHEFAPQNYQSNLYTSGDGYYSIRPDGYLTHCDCVLVLNGVSCTKNTTPANGNTMTYYSTDGTYLRLDVAHDPDSDWRNNPWTLYLPDGGRVTRSSIDGNAGSTPPAVERIYDRNDNYVEIESNLNSQPATTRIADQLGRQIIIEYGAEPNRDYIHATGANGEPLRWTVQWSGISVNKDYYTARNGVAPRHVDFGLRVVDQITLPAQAGGLSYSFDYSDAAHASNGWGELNSVTLPSGARAEYAYKYDGQNNLYWYQALQNHPTRKDLKYTEEYDNSSTPATETWQYEFNFYTESFTSYLTKVTSPGGGVTADEINYSDLIVPAFDHALSYRTTYPDGSVVERLWKHNTPTGNYGGAGLGNAYLKTEYTSIRNAAGALTKTAIKDFDYDKNGNVTRVAEYDWVTYGSVTRTNPGFGQTGQPTAIPQSAPLKRITVNRYYNPTPDAADGTIDPDAYNYASSKRARNSLQSSEIWDASQLVSRTELSYDDPATRGNLTLQRSWDSTKGPLLGAQQDAFRLDANNSVSVRREYDDNATDPALRFGNLTLSVDANGNRTKYTYGAVSRPDGTTFTGLYPTTVVIAEGTSVQRTSSSVYDFSSGLVTKTTDEDNHVSTSITYDAFGRSILVEEADGAVDANGVSIERHTSTEFSDSLRRVIARSDLNATGDGKLVSVQHYDQLGRVRLRRALEDSSTQSAEDENSGIKVQARYLTDSTTQSSYQLTSNPYRAAHSSDAGGETTMGWTLSSSDQAGRVVRAESFSGAALPAPFAASNPNTGSTGAVLTSYDAESATVTDQAGRQRRSVYNGLGRLAQVYEAPNATGYNYQTSYSYDAFGNLKQVVQGVQTRTFDYSSLSRLVSAKNPESGEVSYTYDNNGNLKTKTDARGISTTYTYDALGRTTFKDYSDTTPDVTYSYDTATNGKGLPASVSSSMSAYNYLSYDPLGRVRASSQVTDGQTYAMSYEYNLAGALKSQTYPSGKVVATEFDPAGRIAGVKNQGTENYYAGAAPTDVNNRLRYAAQGAVSAMKQGNGLWEHTTFNSRLQPTQIALGTSAASSSLLRLDYTYGTTDNNGNVRTQAVAVPGAASTFVQTFGYDELNRLQSAEETANATTAWRQVYSYDPFGNRTLAAGTTLPATLDGTNNPSISPSNNRINGAGYSYDAAGNLLCDPSRPCAQTPFTAYYAYDAEGKLVSANGGFASGGTTYSYDGDGRRVKKATANGEASVFVYDATGQLVAEYGNAQPTGGTSYLTQDLLGSTRVIANGAGQVTSRQDYLPFGEEVGAGVGGRTTAQGYSGTDNMRQKFVGYERDAETGLDYAQARYFANTQGRFTSPDPLLSSGKPLQPQSWNRYSYVLNNPLKYIDPLGLIWGTKVGDSNYKWFDDEKALKEAGYSAVTNFLYERDGTFYAVNPNANEWKSFNNGYDASRTYWGYTGLAASWQDWVPVWGQFRQMLFNIATENYEGAMGNFALSSADGGTLAAGAVGGASRQAATEAGEGALRFSQTTASAMFSQEGSFAGMSIGEVANGLRSGLISPGDVPVGVVDNLIVNTRSSLALTRAGIPQSSWNIVDLSSNQVVRSQIQQRLMSNGLTNQGTDVLRITGLGKSASSLK